MAENFIPEEFIWDPEDKRLREDGMAADGSRLNNGDIMENGEEWYVGWPDPNPMAELAPPEPPA